MFKEGIIVYNTRLKKEGKIVSVHPEEGRTTSTQDSQNAYTVEVDNIYEVWLEKTDYLKEK